MKTLGMAYIFFLPIKLDNRQQMDVCELIYIDYIIIADSVCARSLELDRIVRGLMDDNCLLELHQCHHKHYPQFLPQLQVCSTQ